MRAWFNKATCMSAGGADGVGSPLPSTGGSTDTVAAAATTAKAGSNIDGKVSRLTILSYGMGDVGCNFSWMFVGNFLMYFYSEICQISMMAISTLFIVSRIWDALNDPVIGFLSDRTRSKMGRFRPWLLFGAPVVAVLLTLTFTYQEGMDEGGRIIYMYVTYCLLVLGYTCVNLPYGTLLGTLTQNMYERAKLNTSRSVCAMIAINVINVITLPLINFFSESQGQAHGFMMVAMCYGTIFTLCHWITFKNTKEVVTIPAEAKYPLKTQFKAVLQNKLFLIAVAGQFLFGVAWYGRNADLLYYFKYVALDENIFTVFSAVIIAPSILGSFSFPFVFLKLGNKGHTGALFALMSGISLFAIYFVDITSSPIIFYVLAGVSNFFLCAFNTAIYAVIPDCVEYGQYKTGIRNDGFQYAFISLANKIGMAIGTALLALALSLAGYEANGTQNENVVEIVRWGFSIAPAIVWFAAAAVLFMYNMRQDDYARIVLALSQNKQNEAKVDAAIAAVKADSAK